MNTGSQCISFGIPFSHWSRRGTRRWTSTQLLERREQCQTSSLVLQGTPPDSQFGFSVVKPCDLCRTTANFARRRSEADCFQKQLWGDTFKLFKTCACIFECKQNLHQNAVGHPTACRMQARSADFTSLEMLMKSAYGISSGLQELLAAKGIFQRNSPWSPATLTIHVHVKLTTEHLLTLPPPVLEKR